MAKNNPRFKTLYLVIVLTAVAIALFCAGVRLVAAFSQFDDLLLLRLVDQRRVHIAMSLVLLLGPDINAPVRVKWPPRVPVLRSGLGLKPFGYDGIIPLQIAAGNGDLETVRFLIIHGANINAADPDGGTALDWALSAFGANPSTYPTEVIDFLIDNGADLRRTNSVGWTYLYHPVMSSVFERALFDLLIAKGLDVKPTGKYGYTPLHMAGSPEAVKALLDHGADVHAKITDGEEPFSIAARRLKRTDVLEALLEAGAKPNSQDNQGRTALHHVAEKGKAKVSEFLLAHGADPNIKDNDGKTPLDLAVQRGYTEVAELMRKHGTR